MKAATGTGFAAGAGVALLMMFSGAAQAQSAAGSDGSAPAQKTIQMVGVQAQLDHGLNAKKAKQGEAITAKLTANVQIPNEQELPKNTELEGHIDQVQPSEHKGDSTVVVTFDKARLKGGKELPIKATVMAISEPVFAQQQQSGGGGAMPEGGMAGGAPQGGGAAPGGSNMPSQAAPSQPMPEAGATAGNQSSGRNGVPGVTLTSDIHQQTSATFTAKGRNVEVPGGTQLQVALAVIPAGVRLQP